MPTDLITFEDRMKVCRQLAELRGWHNIQPCGTGHLVGLLHDHTGYMILPMWTEDWGACMTIATALGISLDFSDPEAVHAKGAPKPLRYTRFDGNKGLATRYAVAVAAIYLLKERKNNEK